MCHIIVLKKQKTFKDGFMQQKYSSSHSIYITVFHIFLIYISNVNFMKMFYHLLTLMQQCVSYLSQSTLNETDSDGGWTTEPWHSHVVA